MSGYWFWLDLEMTGLDPQRDRILEAAAIVTRVQPGAKAITTPAQRGAEAIAAQTLGGAAAATRFEVVAQWESAVFQPQEVLDTMDAWNRKTHGESGLTARVPHGISEAALDLALCELADRYWASTEKTAQKDDCQMLPETTAHKGGAASASQPEPTISTTAPVVKASGVILCGNSIGQDRKFVDRYLPQFASRLHYRMLDVSSFKIVHQELYGQSFKKSGTHRALDDIRESIAELQFYLAG